MAGRIHTFVGSAAIIRATEHAGQVSHVLPAARFDWSFADEAKWVISVESVVGSPTAWSLDVIFEYAVSNTTGGRNENPVWYPMDTVSVSSDVVEGVPFEPFSNTDTLPRAQKRTIRNFGANMRIKLTPTFTGGTNPGLRITVTAETK